MRIKELQSLAYRNAKEKGFHPEGENADECFPRWIALIHSEASEALESHRNREPTLYFAGDSKPYGIASELADIVIRVLDTSEALGIDLETVIVQKINYNFTRTAKHGGKRY